MILPLERLRREAHVLFQEAGCPARPPFLRRSQDSRSLLCSDAPRRLHDPGGAARLFSAAGIPFFQEGGLWFLDAPLAWYREVSLSPPPSYPPPQEEGLMAIASLCRLLLAHPCAIGVQPLGPVREVLKAMEAGEDQVLLLAKTLPPCIAALLRKKEPLPALAGDLLARWLAGRLEKELI